jgi:protein-S-isoprenylcysteine O-methyltransferase Ste14
MDARSVQLRKTIIIRFMVGIIVTSALLFLPAGSLLYWQGWIYLAVIFVPLFFAVLYLLKNDPGLLERRMKLQEKTARQKRIVLLSSVIFFIGFLIPGLDYRYQWSEVPVLMVLAANLIVFLGYVITFLTLRENSFASRIIEVDKEQKVISSGPYRIIRHPMYAGVLLMFLFSPLALGSYWALVVMSPLPLLFMFRILNEEEVLSRELPGYQEYCRKVKYRLVPYVW